ncbi:MAG TPA: 4-alpha-glucanotransferase [bacterium]|nr:4-alpha-glucanotransferase [bacterium]
MNELRALRALARLHHVQTAYTDITGMRRIASPDALLRVLQALGVAVSGAADAPDVLRAEQARAHHAVPPVFVVRAGRPVVTLPPMPARVKLELLHEDGTASRWTVGGTGTQRGRTVRLPASLQTGYYRLRVAAGRESAEALLIVAPQQAYTRTPGQRVWGAFLPLYALRSAGDWGAGDFSALGELADWVGALGGSVVATLPLLPVFLDTPFDPSPYAPVSRRFWNEFYIDVERVHELSDAPAAQALVAAPPFQRMLQRDRRRLLVQYSEQMRRKRRVLEALADAFFRRAGPHRRAAFDRFISDRPDAAEYAAFRAAMDRIQRPWQQWPSRLRDGTLRPGDYEDTARRYHLYAQWIAAEQFASTSARIRDAGGMMYVDLPLGTHRWGYDAWRDRSVFIDGVSTGAPPDTFFRQGQNWGAQPLHPQRLRQQGYRYFIECLRHHLAHANLLRIDHVMGLHRSFWIPHGMPAADGVYVRYPADEFYAILAVESVRHRAMLVGENLGTVPREVTAAMRRRRVLQTYVVQYALQPSRTTPLGTVPADAVAAINTHDMPPFAAFWKGRDLRDLVRLGQLTSAQAAAEGRRRTTQLRALSGFLRRRRFLRGTASAAAMLRALLAYLGAGPARVVLVSLEDLWGESRPQNTPGTADERPNWRRKAALSLQRMRRVGTVSAALRDLDRSRRAKAGR